MTTLLDHEELISKAMNAYENSTINYGLTDGEMVEKLRGLTDAGIWGFINYCEANK